MELVTMQRDCGGCTECCKGWISFEVKGRKYQPGNPCHYKGEHGCTIHENRPEDPCKAYFCAWVAEPEFIPEWLKPNNSGVICTRRKINGISFLDVVECGKQINSSVLNWLILEHINTGQNLRYRINGGINFIGQKDFIEALNGQYDHQTEV
jgi:hypothetical protein